MIRIVIADDHTIMREGLKRILDGALDIEIVGEAINGFEVLSLVRQGGFDLLLLDLSMPGRSGVDLIRQVRSEAPKLAILILTMHEEEQYAVRAIRAGAQGYLTKESANNLHLSVKTVSTHKTRIMQKMGMTSLSEMVQYAVAHRLLAPMKA
jgi:DNA-binding NarL/FixJ family response regulator